jgi:hypothetical protein
MADMPTPSFVRIYQLIQEFNLGETQVHTETKWRLHGSAFHLAGKESGLIIQSEIDLRHYYAATWRYIKKSLILMNLIHRIMYYG